MSKSIWETLPVYSGDSTRCEKCGADGAKTTYVAPEPLVRGFFTPEHLRRTCYICGYWWPEAPITPPVAPGVSDTATLAGDEYVRCRSQVLTNDFDGEPTRQCVFIAGHEGRCETQEPQAPTAAKGRKAKKDEADVSLRHLEALLDLFDKGEKVDAFTIKRALVNFHITWGHGELDPLKCSNELCKRAQKAMKA